jgi:hypothetical protein
MRLRPVFARGFYGCPISATGSLELARRPKLFFRFGMITASGSAMFPQEVAAMPINRIGVSVLGCVFLSTSVAGSPARGYTVEPPVPLQQAFGTQSAWRVVITDQPRNGLKDFPGPLSHSRVCFVESSHSATQCTPFNVLFGTHDIQYQVVDSLSIAPLASRPARAKGLILKASADYPTGSEQELAIWVYDTSRDRFRLVLALTYAEERLFTDGTLNGNTVVANWVWEPGETRFGSKHRRRIRVYRYVKGNDGGDYHKVLDYSVLP